MSAIVIRPDLRARKACDDAALLVWMLQNDFLAEIFGHLDDPKKIEQLVIGALDLVEEIQNTLALKTSAKGPDDEPSNRSVPTLRESADAMQARLQREALKLLAELVKRGEIEAEVPK